MPWAVVEFLSRNEVEVVPVCWLDDHNTTCYWPEKSFRQSELIKKQAQPDTSSWRQYSVRVFDCYDSLAIAREKCKRSEIYSDLSSGTEESRNRTHKTFIRPKCCTSEDEVPRKKLKFGSGSSSSESDDSDCNTLPIPELPNSNLAEKFTISEKTISAKRDGQKEQDWPSTSKSNLVGLQSVTPENSSERQRLSTPRPVVETATNLDQEWKKKIETSLTHIKLMLEHIVDIVETSPNIRGKKNVDDIIDEISDRCPVDLNTFPVSSDKQLQEIENLLSDKDTHLKVVRDLARVGGKTVKETTRRLLRRILTNNVAQNYSYFGFKKKNVFQSLRINSVIHDAVKKNKDTECATEKEVEAEIQDWLRQAKGRINSKEKIGVAVQSTSDVLNSSLSS